MLESYSTQDSYNKSYCHFVKYFKDKRRLTEHDLIIAADFTYGWIPTILEYKSDEFDLSVSVINKANHSKRTSDEELLILKKLINNSIVAELIFSIAHDRAYYPDHAVITVD